MENDRDNDGDRTGSGIVRGQNQLHFIPEDWQAAAAAIQPLADRLDESSDTTQMVIVTGDVDAAAGIGGRLGTRLVASPRLRLVTATDGRRALRVLRRAPAHILVATPDVLAELMQAAAVKLHDARVAVLAWVDDLDAKGTRALEAVMTEVPKDAARIVLASGGGAAGGVEQLVERYARRARRMQGTAGEADPVSISYLAVGAVARPMALRRLLDALDPESAFVVVTTDDSRREVGAGLRALGYAADAVDVRAGDLPDGPVDVIVLYDFPASAEQLRATMAPAPTARVVGLVAPRQLATLRRWAGGSVTPLVLPDAALRARAREDAVREEIRESLAAGGFSRELIALEPLLADHDGIEVAAALLRMLELDRARARTPTAAAAPAAPAMTRVFVNVGEMDGVRPGDLVGAITNEAGLSKAEVGRVEIRERHSTVEVSTAVANTVVSKLTGVSIRGRRALVKIDEGRDRRDSEGGGRRERGGPRGGPQRDRGSRPSRPPRPPSRTR